MNVLRLFVAAGVMLCISNSAYGQLVWDHEQLDFHPTLHDKEVVANFTFQNKGQYPVTIQEVKPSCNCTTIKWEKKTYGPGEKGVVVATLHIKYKSGFQNQTVVVQTDDRSHDMLELTLTAALPALVELNPSHIFWSVGEASSVKPIEVKFVVEDKINITEVESSNPRIVPQLKTLSPGVRYEVAVTPTDTTSTGYALITLISDYPKDNPKKFYAYAQIKTQASPSTSGR